MTPRTLSGARLPVSEADGPLELSQALLHQRAPLEGVVGLVEGHRERVALREDLVPLQGWRA